MRSFLRLRHLEKRRCGQSRRSWQSTPAGRDFCPQGLGTKEGVIIEILASRTKNQLQEIMKAYEEGKGWHRWRGLGVATSFGSLAGNKDQEVTWTTLERTLWGLFYPQVLSTYRVPRSVPDGNIELDSDLICKLTSSSYSGERHVTNSNLCAEDGVSRGCGPQASRSQSVLHSV